MGSSGRFCNWANEVSGASGIGAETIRDWPPGRLLGPKNGRFWNTPSTPETCSKVMVNGWAKKVVEASTPLLRCLAVEVAATNG